MQQEPDKLISQIDQFRVVREIGSGYTSTVYLVRDEKGTSFAAKKFNADKIKKYFQNEINIMKKLAHQQGHPNIIKIHEVREDATFIDEDGNKENCTVIFMEYAKCGELYDFISSTGNIPENMVRVYFSTLVSAIKYMHDKNIYHRDIKPQNILLTEEFSLKITDFGFSIMSQNNLLQEQLGTKAYMAPQIARNQPYNGQKIDLFALGYILFQLVMGIPPFDHVGDILYGFIRNKDYQKFWHSFRKIDRRIRPSNEFKLLFQSLVADNPYERPNHSQILNHPWFGLPKADWMEIMNEFLHRKVRVDAKKQQLKISQRIRKNTLMRRVHNQGVLRTGTNQPDLQKQIDKLVSFYEQQQQRDRQLLVFDHVNSCDMVLSENNCVAFAFLNEYLQKKQKGEKASDERIERVYIEEDCDSRMMLRFINKDKEQNKQIGSLESNILFKLQFGEDRDYNLILKFDLIEGDELYFRRKKKQIQQLYYYCLIETNP